MIVLPKRPGKKMIFFFAWLHLRENIYAKLQWSSDWEVGRCMNTPEIKSGPHHKTTQRTHILTSNKHWLVF